MGQSQGEPGVAPAPHTLKPRHPADVAWVASTNFGEGLHWSVIHQMGTDYLTAVRAPLAQVGYTSWLHLATTFKFLWSPVIDLAGTKRRWMVALQVALGLGMIGIGFVSRAGLGGLGSFWLALSALAIMGATHDIACDGYYLLALNRNDQALYAGPRVAAFRAAMYIGNSLLISLAGMTSWTWGFGAAGVLMVLLGICNALFIPRIDEPKVERPTRARRSLRDYWAAYATFFDQPRAPLMLLFILTLKLGDIMMFAMSRPLMRDLGLDTVQRGHLGGWQTAAQIAGAIIAGGILARGGIERRLTPIIYFMNLVIPLYALMAWTSPSYPWIVAIVSVEQFAGGMGATAQSVYLMQRCRRAFSASHYAFATAVTALGTTLSGAFSGHLDAALGHRWYFIVCFAFGIPSMVLVLLVPKAPIETT